MSIDRALRRPSGACVDSIRLLALAFHLTLWITTSAGSLRWRRHPEVAQFCPAELGAELAISTYSAELLVGDALNLRHRLPRLWARVRTGVVKPWIGRKTAQATRSLTAATVAAVDEKATRWADRLSWGRLEPIISATAIAADADYAQAEADRARADHGVWLSQATDLGTKTAFIRGDAIDLLYFDATIDRIADGIGLLGDTTGEDTRRARAVGIVANPQQTLDLFHDVNDVVTAGGVDPKQTPDGLTSDAGLAEADSHGADGPDGVVEPPPTPTDPRRMREAAS